MIFDARSSVELLDDGRDGLRRFIGVYSFRWFHSVRWSHWLGWSRWFRWSSRGGWASIGSGPGFRLDIPDRTAMACFQAEGQGNTVSLVRWMGAGCGRGGEVRRCVYESVEGCCAGEGGGCCCRRCRRCRPRLPPLDRCRACEHPECCGEHGGVHVQKCGFVIWLGRCRGASVTFSGNFLCARI